MKNGLITRRQFMGAAAAGVVALGGCSIVPRHTVARSGKIPPSEQLAVASIGIGGMGGGDLRAVAGIEGVRIVAVCDVDDERAAENLKKYSSVPRYKDFRRMLEERDRDIDAVTVGIPDHAHAPAAIAAMQLGKHVYCEKPLAHSIYEVRQMMKAAKRHNVVTQLGNQGHSFESCALFVEMIRDGAIGNVHTIECGCSAVNSAIPRLEAMRTERPPVPSTLDWNLWLGPAAERPYHESYLPGRWRGWVPFGNGTIGDWVCHVVDPVFWALDLGAPSSIVAEVKDYDVKTQGEAYPRGEIVTFKFAAKGKRGPVTLRWYSGAEKIPRPKELDPGRREIETGAAVYGDKGAIAYGSHGATGCRIIPEAKMQQYTKPQPTIPRVKEHHLDWVTSIRTGKKAGSDFSYGGPLTEIAMLGIIAVKMAGTELAWDGEKGRFTNCDEANAFIAPKMRKGWEV